MILHEFLRRIDGLLGASDCLLNNAGGDAADALGD